MQLSCKEGGRQSISFILVWSRKVSGMILAVLLDAAIASFELNYVRYAAGFSSSHVVKYRADIKRNGAIFLGNIYEDFAN